MSAPDEPYKALFSYGHMRATYIPSNFSDQGCLSIAQFVRPEYLEDLRHALINDQAIFLQHPNTQQQSELSPVSRQCLWELHSGIMIRLLENITGISNLLPDTHCQHSGFNAADAPNAYNPTLLLSICLTTGNAALKQTNTPSRNPSEIANTFHMYYWQSPALLGEAAP